MAESGDLHLSPHIALIPSAGMGHLTPFLRFAASLVDRHCQVTLITIQPTISNAESQLVTRFLSAYPQVHEKQLHLLPFDPSTANSTDPFWLRWEATRRSVSLISPLLSSSLTSPPISAIVYDISLMSAIIPVVAELSLPGYVFFTASARMFSFLASFSTSVEPKLNSGFVKPTDILEIPSLSPVTVSMIPPVLLNPKHLFSTIFREDSPNVMKSNGILINTFGQLEPETLAALNSGTVVAELSPVYDIGPLTPFDFEKTELTNSSPVKWLDDQPTDSVVFISFGSRTPMSTDQIREIGAGLATSGCRFLWLVKMKKVDREEEEDDILEVLGPEIAETIKDRGLVVKDWVDQNEILAHNSVGGFLSHCGWNSVVEAALHGVRILAWPQLGDQQINAEVVEKAGFGIWERSWGWGMASLVRGDEIGEKIKEMMESESLKRGAATVSGEARKALAESGSRESSFQELINKWKNI
ncbi:hypothetical protein ACFE04_025023 [Oxalis oulophora]